MGYCCPWPTPAWEREVGQRLFAFIWLCIPHLAPSAVTDVFPLKVYPEMAAGPVGELEWGHTGPSGWHVLPGPLTASLCPSEQTERSYGVDFLLLVLLVSTDVWNYSRTWEREMLRSGTNLCAVLCYLGPFCAMVLMPQASAEYITSLKFPPMTHMLSLNP